jgi:hypothetical protein
MQTYNALHRKSSDSSHSAAVSYFSGTESQQSVSDKSFYDNLPVETYDHRHDKRHATNARNFLMPPMKNSLRCIANNNNNSINPHVNVSRSVSFQDSSLPRPKNIVIRRRNLNDMTNCSSIHTDISASDRSSCLSMPSSSKMNIDCSSVVVRSDDDANVTCYSDSNHNDNDDDPFYRKLLRRMQKISTFWRLKRRPKKPRSRGRLPHDFPIN